MDFVHDEYGTLSTTGGGGVHSTCYPDHWYNSAWHCHVREAVSNLHY